MVTKTMALLFLPFSTKVIYYDHLDDMLSDFFVAPVAPSVQLSALGSHAPMDQIDIYVGEACNNRLGNLWRFLRYNNLDFINVGTSYTMAIAIGRNVTTGVYVDIPLSAFPWMSDRYGLIFDYSFFDTVPDEIQTNNHRLLGACMRCKSSKRRCVRTHLACSSCLDSGSECRAGADEAQRRRWGSAAYIRSNIYVMCAIHQYTINLFLRANGHFLFATEAVSALGTKLNEEIVAVQNVQMESAIKTYADAFQEVSIYMGAVQIMDRCNDDELWGFQIESASTNSKDVISSISPHLGMTSPMDACSLIDSALNSPGDMFYRDICILDRAFKPRSARVMTLAAVISPRHVEILVAWKFP